MYRYSSGGVVEVLLRGMLLNDFGYCFGVAREHLLVENPLPESYWSSVNWPYI